MRSEKRAAAAKGPLVFLCTLLLALQPIWGAPAPVAIGTVSGGGPVQLNGIAAPVGTIVYTGNQIETGPKGVGNINLSQGGKLVLGASSSARVSEDAKVVSVKLDYGVLGAVSEAKAPVVVTAAGVTIRTKRAAGVYEVALKGTSLKVLADRGTSIAAATSRTVEVPEGKVLDATVNPGSSLTGAEEFGIAALIAGGIAGIGLGVALSQGGKKSCISAGQLNCQ